MVREISAGGVVVRKVEAIWHIAAIEPQKNALGSELIPAKSTATVKKKSSKIVLALPKGLVDPGEKPEQTAVREVQEETGLTARPLAKLLDIKYVYVRSWGDGERVFKVVSFYLLEYVSGNIGEIAPEMQVEVKQALWVPLDEAVRKLAYRGERDVVRKAQEYLAEQSGVAEDGA